MPDRPEVTAVEIARLAGVGRAAVSNWRRRHPDFPQPVGGTDASPTFALAAVESWLQGQGKIAELPVLERAWRRLETLRDPAGHPAAPLVPAGAFLLLLHREPETWPALAAEPDTRLATALPRALARVAALTFGIDGAAQLGLPGLLGSTYLDLVRLLADLARPAGGPAADPQAAGPAADAPAGPAAAFERLLTRHAEANTRQLSPTPPEAAGLLAAVAGPLLSVPGATAFDPAVGLGAVLLALPPEVARYGQDLDPVSAALALLRLALHTPATDPGPLPLDLRAGDSLRADAHPGLAVDAVLCQPPYNERDWGHDELQYDSRWPAGQLPPRGESELAWVLHCLSHTRPGGLTALLLPPTVASRRAGRRVRAELLRSGTLRAVIALPAGAAPPYGVPLHLWVLRRPAPGDDFRQVLLLDAAPPQAAGEGGRDRVDWPELRATVTASWQAFDEAAATGRPVPADRPGTHRVMAAIDLLDDETDLSPARHVPPAAPAGDAPALAHLRGRLTELLAGLTEQDAALPEAGAARQPGHPPAVVTVGELIRSGALQVVSSGPGAPGRPAGHGAEGVPLLTDQDLIAGTAPTAVTDSAAVTDTAAVTDPGAPDAPVLTRAGDVLVPALGGGVARVVLAGGPLEGVALGRQLHLLRPDPALVDPEFLAGQLRSTALTRRAASHASTTARLDIRRVELPRLPPDRQRVLGAAFARVAAFDTALHRAAALGRTLAQGLTDGLADGTLELPAGE
ncbi:N-6 DNA methylase [Kitasatospora sp. NBC_00240]|uniref:N-6 DNA methylase n=1 Tax=Kitasatospora sp. NBC_00240 TaxID=2903567 RepID=UPI00224DE995|nr:N-6 DNA methylase [Kitasatospora sp. NBC_00240]MCX5211086.1 N-6 DNA methylase [Kitasatospora sp. NBC_00240]